MRCVISMARSRASDSQLDSFQEEDVKRACGKTTHGELRKTRSLSGEVVWHCPEYGCDYKENKKGEKV